MIDVMKWAEETALAFMQAYARLVSGKASDYKGDAMLADEVSALRVAFAWPFKERLTAVILSAHAKGRNEGLEEAEKVSKSHRGSASRRRLERGQKLSQYNEDAAAEIQAEERGEDIAAEIITAAISALKTKEPT